MLEATKTEQEIVINKLQTEVVKLKEKVRHLCKLRQDLLEQRSQVEDRMRSVNRVSINNVEVASEKIHVHGPIYGEWSQTTSVVIEQYS